MKRRPARREARIFLGDAYPGVYLTLREAEYVWQALHGKKRREIAAVLAISSRTLDSYIQSVKTKLGCLRSRDIVMLIQKTNFIQAVHERIDLACNSVNVKRSWAVKG